MSFLKSTHTSLKNPTKWMFTTWFKLLSKYRRTTLGPLWMLVHPIMFILFLGALFVGLSDMSTSIFIPHLAIGFIVWGVLGGVINKAPTVFIRHGAFLMTGKTSQTDLLMLDYSDSFINFLHQCLIIVAVVFLYGTISWHGFSLSMLGLALLILTGYPISYIFGMFGTRYKDFGQLVTPIVSIAFLATPIIWMMPEDGGLAAGRAAILEAYTVYNPFFHFLEAFRAPLLGRDVDMLSWYVCLALCGGSWLLAIVLYSKYNHMIAVWAEMK